MARARDLRVVISGDEKGLARAFASAGAASDKFAKQTEGVHVRIRRSFSGMAVSAAKAGVGIAGAYASIEGAKKAIDTTEELAHTTLGLHKNLGLSVKSASEWAAVARARGIDSKQLSQAFGTLAKNVEAGIKPTSAQADAFKRLGLSHAELKRGDFGRVLGDVADGMGRLQGGTEKTALGMKLFGRGWQTVLPVLREGSKGMRDQLALADKYGVTFKGKTVKSLEDLIKAQRESKFATMGLQVAFGTMLAPALTKAIGAVNHFVLGIREGTGAGGRFADKLKDIADKVRPIVKFFTDHPRLVAGAVAAWATYRLAVAAATAVSRLKMLGMFAGLAPKAAVEGAVAGRAFGGAASTSAGTTFSRRAPGMFAAGRFAGAGRAIGALLGTAIMAEVASKFDGPAWAKIMRGLVPFQPSPGGGKIKLGKPVKLPDGTTYFPPAGAPAGSRPKGYTNPSRQSPFRPSTKLGALPSQHRSGNKPRAHTSAVAHAASVGGPVAHAASGTYSGSQLAALWIQEGGSPGAADTAAAVALAESGGNPNATNHNTDGSIDRGLWQINSVHGHLSTMDPAANARAAITISSNGTNWSPWVTYQTGAFQKFMGGATGGTRAPSITGAASVVARRRPATAHLEHGQSGRSKGMGARLPKVDPADRIGIEPGAFVAAPTQEQIDLLTGDPTTDPKARLARQFQLGMRRNTILRALKSGRIRNPATRKRLLEELTGINSELGQLAQPIDTGTADAATPDTSAADAAAQAEQDRTDAIKANTDALNAVKDETKRLADVATNTTSIEMGVLAKGLADFISGQITGTGYDPRAMTAGAGALARY